jgi:uncharacterized protein YecT (DUF1311 family)
MIGAYRFVLWMAAIALSTTCESATLRIGGADQASPDSASEGTKSELRYDACLRKAHDSLAAQTTCAEDERARIDRVLNEVYRSVMERMAPIQRTRLQSMERRWIAQLGPFCRAEVLRESREEHRDSRGAKQKVAAVSAQDANKKNEADCFVYSTRQRVELLEPMAEFFAP